ncbi:hypothetical protein LCGC14_0913550 [marine sediment metagenome]|uniref:Uncharacterized protein n=1 Tax=marine sediment metagenome TaxID=412755 RepID=A0A0F9PDN6_9ZZZZ
MRTSSLWEDVKPKDTQDWLFLGLVLAPPVGTTFAVILSYMRQT